MRSYDPDQGWTAERSRYGRRGDFKSEKAAETIASTGRWGRLSNLRGEADDILTKAVLTQVPPICLQTCTPFVVAIKPLEF